MHENDIFMHENDISMHGNDDFATELILSTKKFSWEIGLYTISCIEFSSMKFSGQKSYFHARKFYFPANKFHFLAYQFHFHAWNFFFLHMKFICMKMRFSCQNNIHACSQKKAPWPTGPPRWPRTKILPVMSADFRDPYCSSTFLVAIIYYSQCGIFWTKHLWCRFASVDIFDCGPDNEILKRRSSASVQNNDRIESWRTLTINAMAVDSQISIEAFLLTV